jgi:hypothetical protein
VAVRQDTPFVSSMVGESYPDQSAFDKGTVRRYVTFKLKLQPSQCVSGENLGFLQFSLPTDIPKYADVIEYDKSNKPKGWISFVKR